MILEQIRDFVINGKLAEEQLIIRGLWSVDCLFKPNIKERTFNHKFIVAQTIGQGSAYSTTKEYDVEYLASLMGKSYYDLIITDTALDIAILDAIYATIQRKPDQQIELSGTSVDKAETRAKVIVEEAMKLINRNNLKNEKPLVANVGVVGNIIKELLDNDIQVIGADFDGEIVGKRMFGEVEIVDGANTLKLIEQCDLAIVTGMTLTTNTLDEILAVAKEYNTRLVIFAETGSNFGEVYINNGVDCVVGEPFPFYIYQGKNTLNIFRKKTEN